MVTSEDSGALLEWLDAHERHITEPMRPLIRAYTKERFLFLAMSLLPDPNLSTQDIQPVVMTYVVDTPTIPIQLTGTNYLNVIDQIVDVEDRIAFVTEYAQPTQRFLADKGPPDLITVDLAREHEYIARMSPEEIILDPEFTIRDGQRKDVDNVRDPRRVSAQGF